MKKNNKKLRGLAVIACTFGLFAGSAILAKAETVIKPVNPSNLTALTNVTVIDLKWEDNSSNESYFSLERDHGGMNFSEIAKLAPDTTSYSDTNLVSGVYFYRVRAVNDAGVSGYSNIADAYSPVSDPRPAAPSNLSAIAGISGVVLKWKDNSTNETHFMVSKSSSGVQYPSIKVPQNNTAFFDQKVEAGKTYTYSIRAYNGNWGSLGILSTITIRVPDNFKPSVPVRGLVLPGPPPMPPAIP